MVCTWTSSYTYQPGTEDKCTNDIVCDAIMSYVEENGEKHNMRIVTKKDSDFWHSHGKPIEITRYFLKRKEKEIPIEEVAAEILAYYECAMNDESTNCGENAVYIGEPWSAEDLAYFTQEMMVEYWN